jgi:putative transposase
LQYRPCSRSEDQLRLALIRLAKQYGRYGYRKVGQLLRAEGWRVNHKKVERIWREEGLQLPQRHKKRKRLDEYTREALCVKVATSMGSSDVLEALYPLLLERGTPTHIRSDNGPEFVSAPFQEWLRRVGIEPIRIYPGSPWENGYNERFNGTLRREVLNAEWFSSTRQAQIVINQWLRQYNHIRPHHALAMRPPVPETLLEKSNITGPVTGG